MLLESKLKVDTLINMTSNDYKIFNINISEAVVVHIRNFLISEKEKGVELMEVETTTSVSYIYYKKLTEKLL